MWGVQCTQRDDGRDDGPKEVRNHHAPLTPRRKPLTGLFKRASESVRVYDLAILASSLALHTQHTASTHESGSLVIER